VLGNHGLVIGGQDCHTVEDLLCDVERRLMISPRVAPEPRDELLAQLARVSEWRLPGLIALHALGTDPTSQRILKKVFFILAKRSSWDGLRPWCHVRFSFLKSEAG
jgi:hypothetical protein